MTNESSNGSAGSGKGGARTGALYDEGPLRLERVLLKFRALLDTLGETSRAARSVEGLDRGRVQLDLADQVEAMGPLWSDLARLIRAGAIDDLRGKNASTADETSETRRARRARGEDSQPGKKR
jgi:hypothetical protein